jgi:hypothetical protein
MLLREAGKSAFKLKAEGLKLKAHLKFKKILAFRLKPSALSLPP